MSTESIPAEFESAPDGEFATERRYDVGRAQVWDVVSSPELLGRWLGSDVEIDGPLEAGAEGTVVDSDGTRRVMVVDDVIEGQRISYRWASAADAPTQVVFDVVPDGEQTRLIIIERQLAPTGGGRRGQTMMMAGAR